jgi:pimeloyl-ACP methyl ester carboxylesterase
MPDPPPHDPPPHDPPQHDPPRHERRWVNGVRLHVITAGSGPAVVLLHGWPQTSYAWRKVIPGLSGRFSVICPDMRGFGASSKPSGGFDKKTVARDVLDLARSFGHDRFALAGHDMGGQVGYAVAAQWPGSVTHFAFIESGLPGFGQEKSMNVATGGSWHFGFNMAGDISEELVRGRERIFVEHFLLRDSVGVVDPTSIDEQALATYADALARPGALRCTFSYYRTLLEDAQDNLALGRSKLPMPVLAVSTQHGAGAGPFATMRAVAANVRHAQIAQCGHYPAEEQPAELTRLLTDFFTGGDLS